MYVGVCPLWLHFDGGLYDRDLKPVQSKSMFISIDQLPKIIEFHTIIVHNYSSVDFILIFFDTSAAILKNLKLY